MNYILVMIGGALGALSRYSLGQILTGVRASNIPASTLIINLLGCFILGILTGYASRNVCLPMLSEEQSRQTMLLLTVGFCGAFTTFSTFSGETIKAMEAGFVWQSITYVLISVGIGLLLFWVGKELAN